MTPRPRRPGSCRFDPYVKIQWRDEVSVCWRDVQRSLPDAAAARSLAPSVVPEGARWRLMRITEEGRAPVEDCPVCSGAGYDVVPTHAPGCAGGRGCEQTCPVPEQVECDNCRGTGSMVEALTR